MQKNQNLIDRISLRSELLREGGIDKALAIRNWDGLREITPMERTFNAGMAAFMANQVQTLIGIGFLFAAVAQMVK
jgi:hypothetical protein